MAPSTTHSYVPFQSYPNTPHRIGRSSRNPSIGGQSGFSLISGHFASSSQSLATHTGGGLGDRGTRALLDLQRVLYRGVGYVDDEGKPRGQVTMEEVETFIDETLEMDCVYESPLLTFPNRPLLLSAFLLSAKTTSFQLPSIRPTALYSHTKSLGRAGWGLVFGRGDKGKQASERKDKEGTPVGGEEHWFHPWGVSSECGEIGTMECYDGFHIGFIEQSITLDILPEFLIPRPTAPSHPSTPPKRTSILPTPADFLPPAPSRPSVIQTLSTSLLRHSINLHTVVHLNEYGRIVYIRDILDVRDLAEALVPFGMGRAFGWIGRRLGGFAIAGLGGLIGSQRGEEVVDEGYGIIPPASVYRISTAGLGMSPVSSSAPEVLDCDTLPIAEPEPEPTQNRSELAQPLQLQPPIHLSPKSRHQHRTRLARLTSTQPTPASEGLMLNTNPTPNLYGNTAGAGSPETPKRDEDVLLFGGKRKRGMLGLANLDGQGAGEVPTLFEKSRAEPIDVEMAETSRGSGSGSAPDVDEGYPGSG